eukprot:scaffold4160_cov150-Skeletonema_marinoi.AAC.1
MSSTSASSSYTPMMIPDSSWTRFEGMITYICTPFRRVSWSRRVLLAAAGGISSWMHDVSGN